MNAPIKPKLTDIDLGEVLGIGAALGDSVKTLPGSAHPFMLAPAGWDVKNLETFLPAPLRAAGNVALGDVTSLIRYINKHKDLPLEGEASDSDDIQTVIFMDVINSKFKAVFDHHGSDRPGHAKHSASYDCPLSKEWQIWTGNNGKGKMKDQEEFAFFIEQNILDIHEPSGAQMLQIVTTLKSTKNVQFDSGVRLADGQVQIKYHEEAKTTAGPAGEMIIPEKIKLGIPVYVGAVAYAVEAMFRYRIEGSRLVMWYDLVTPHKVLEDALGKVKAQVAAGTSIEPYAVTAF